VRDNLKSLSACLLTKAHQQFVNGNKTGVLSGSNNMLSQQAEDWAATITLLFQKFKKMEKNNHSKVQNRKISLINI